jgi:hypothetical protein
LRRDQFGGLRCPHWYRIAIQSVCVTIPSTSRADAISSVKGDNVFGGFATGMDFKKFSKN